MGFGAGGAVSGGCSTKSRHHPRKRVIQYSRALMFNSNALEYWIARSSRATTGEMCTHEHTSAISRRDASE
jgi:hypothetical protein